jgi:hypothetical protein
MLPDAIIDKWLITISWIATCIFTVLTLIKRRQSPKNSTLFLNLYLIIVVLAAFCAFAWLTGVSIFTVPTLLWSRLYDGTYKRFFFKLNHESTLTDDRPHLPLKNFQA